MKIKYFINLHKGTTFLFVGALMLAYQNFTIGPWIYLALHGTYGFLWLLKDRIYPDKQWEQSVPLGIGIAGFFTVSLYWMAPFVLISSGSQPSPALIAAAVSLNLFGVFFHFSSDAQKYYTLKYRPGLITEGFFARCRNTNYLGEILIYLSFALLAQHWLPFVLLGGFALAIFVPNMLKKDRSLSRYPEFAAYRDRTGLLLPKLWGTTEVATLAEPSAGKESQQL